MTWFENNFEMWLSFHSSSEEILFMCILVQDLPLLAAPCRWDHHLCTDLKQEGKCSQKDCEKESFQTIAPDQMHLCTEFPDALAFLRHLKKYTSVGKGEDPPSRFEWDNGERIFPPWSHFLFSFRCLLCLLRQMMPGGPGQAVIANQRPSIDWSQMWFPRNRLIEFHWVEFCLPSNIFLKVFAGATPKINCMLLALNRTKLPHFAGSIFTCLQRAVLLVDVYFSLCDPSQCPKNMYLFVLSIEEANLSISNQASLP